MPSEVYAPEQNTPTIVRSASQSDDSHWNLKKIQVDRAWRRGMTGNNVVVAVLDTGVDPLHASFRDRLVTGFNALDGSCNPWDDNGHGTHVASVIASGIERLTGVAYGAKIMPIKVLDDNKSGLWDNVINGLDFAIENGADIINMSFGGTEIDNRASERFNFAIDSGIHLVGAVGNSFIGVPFYPASLSKVIAVGASNEKDLLWRYSGLHQSDLVAPGVMIPVADMGTESDITYSTGTSLAAPHVSAALALLKGHYPLSSREDREQMLVEASVLRSGKRRLDCAALGLNHRIYLPLVFLASAYAILRENPTVGRREFLAPWTSWT